jgi:hypothetical protein
MVAEDQLKRVLEYFNQWQKKVEFEVLEVMLQNQRILRDLARKGQERDNVKIEGE